jgi:hypothetical protein
MTLVVLRCPLNPLLSPSSAMRIMLCLSLIADSFLAIAAFNPLLPPGRPPVVQDYHHTSSPYGGRSNSTIIRRSSWQRPLNPNP